MDSDFILDQNKCTTMRNGILTKGFTLSSKYLCDTFFPIYEMLSDPN